MELLLSGVVGALIILAFFGAWSLWKRRPRRRNKVECMVCEKPLKHRQVHVVASVEEDYSGAGTAVVAEFCGKHCPGGCLKERPPTRKVVQYDGE